MTDRLSGDDVDYDKTDSESGESDVSSNESTDQTDSTPVTPVKTKQARPNKRVVVSEDQPGGSSDRKRGPSLSLEDLEHYLLNNGELLDRALKKRQIDASNSHAKTRARDHSHSRGRGEATCDTGHDYGSKGKRNENASNSSTMHDSLNKANLMSVSSPSNMTIYTHAVKLHHPINLCTKK